MFRMVYPLLPAFRDGLGVSLAHLSQALTWRSLAGMVAPFLASIADSRGRKTGMLFGTLLFSSGVAVVVFWPTFAGFTAALILSTLGKFAFDPAMQAYIGDRVRYERRGLVLALTEVGWSGAFLIGIPLVAGLISLKGWLAPFPLLAGLGFLSFLGLLWLLPGDPPPAVSRPGVFKNMRLVFTSASALAGLVVTLFVSMSNEVVNVVFGVWLEASFSMQVTALGLSATVIGAAELLGEGLVSALVDRLGKKRAVFFGLAAISVATVLLPLIGRSQPGAMLGLFLFYLAFEFTFVSSIPLMSELLPAARATLMALNFASASLGRAIAAYFAPALFARGFGISASAALLINLLAVLALSGVRLPPPPPESTSQ